MPYIIKSLRLDLDPRIHDVARRINTQGELNYAITRLCHEYVMHRTLGPSYVSLNEVHGVLHCVDLELYRTVTGPYEDLKRAENGQVSELDKP